jgi:hypothetical protein
MLAEAIRTKLAADSDVTGALATYTFTTGSTGPAIFTTDPIPEGDASLPAIVITEVGGGWFGDFGARGMEALAEVRIYGPKERTRQVIRDLARDVWEALHERKLNVAGMAENGVWCDAPAEITDPDGFPGFLVRVRVLLLEV